MEDERFDNQSDQQDREEIKWENDIQKLMMQATHGAIFSKESDLSPEVEREFLRSVREFEDAYKSAKKIQVMELLGNPVLKPVAVLDDGEVEDELIMIRNMMEDKGILFDTIHDYPPRVIYSFIVEKFLYHTIEHVDLPGLVACFTYEEFCLNHEEELRVLVLDFMQCWFDMNFGNEFNPVLAPNIILPDDHWTRRQLQDRICLVQAFYSRIFNQELQIGNLGYEWNEDESFGKGQALGTVQYDVELENGECIHFGGDFRICMYNEGNGWMVCYFELPGFSWTS